MTSSILFLIPNECINLANDEGDNLSINRAEIQLFEFANPQRKETISPTRAFDEFRGDQGFPSSVINVGCSFKNISQGVNPSSIANVYKNGFTVDPIWRRPTEAISY